jgi:hypothetical protein
MSGLTGWTVLDLPGETGIDFFLKVNDLLPGARPDERILAFAVAGKRSALLDSSRKR